MPLVFPRQAVEWMHQGALIGPRADPLLTSLTDKRVKWAFFPRPVFTTFLSLPLCLTKRTFLETHRVPCVKPSACAQAFRVCTATRLCITLSTWQGLFPEMARPSFTRSASSASSCIVVDAEAALASSAASTTPPTSITDVGSVTSRTSTKVPSAGDTMTSTTSTNGRARRARPSILSYNENTLSDAARRRSLPLLRTQASSATLLPGAGESQRELVRNSIAVLDMDWKMDGMPGDAMLKDGGRLQRRRSMGMLLESATEKVGKTKSALGKRGRDALEAGKGKLKDLGRRKSLRPRTDLGFVHVPEPEEEPAKKKTRLSAAADKDDEEEKLYEEIKRKPSVKKPTKRWLGQGLYVGQDPDFDPRFTDSRNRAKMASKSGEASKPRKILPMPMFAGKRLIENGRPFRIPFDVFNPLPLGQPKPDEWRKTQKSTKSRSLSCSRY